RNPENLPDPNRPEPCDASPEHGVAQAVLAAASRAIATAPRGGNRRSWPSDSFPPPDFIFSCHSLSRARPIFLSFAQIQPSLFGPVQSDRDGPTRSDIRPAPSHPQIQPSSNALGPARCAPGPALSFAAQLSRVRPNPRTRLRPPHARPSSSAQRPFAVGPHCPDRSVRSERLVF
ncbi:hypothetical protein CRG98_047376, partial [Punica granatum]